jgi:hypothetical protein
MANKDLSKTFLSAMTGNKNTPISDAKEVDTETHTSNALSIPDLVQKNTNTQRKVYSIYLTEDEFDILKDFAAKNGFTRKVRGKDAHDGNLSKLLQNLANQIKEGV